MIKITVIGTNDYRDTSDSELVILTAGLPMKPEMNGADLSKSDTTII